MSAGSEAFVLVKGLKKSFGGQVVLDGLSLAIPEGRTLALLGPSGCGKTTVLRCVAGLEAAEDGMICIGGRKVFDGGAGIDLKPEQRNLGIVFQSYAVWPHMSVAENVGFPLKVRGVARAEIAARVGRVLEAVGLAAWGEKPATQLSGGQQQRVALARAIVHEPKVVLFDEALSNLDAQLREQMRLELRVLQERLKFTAIYVTHDQAEAFALADSVVLMNRGRPEAKGAPQDVFRYPRTAFVARFLGMNVLAARIAEIRRADAPDQALARVVLEGGTQFWGTVGPASGISLGTRAFACIRREHVRIFRADVDHGPPTADRDGDRLPAVVKASSYLGLTEETVIDVAGAELRSIHPPLGLSTGECVTLTVSASECLVLPE